MVSGGGGGGGGGIKGRRCGGSILVFARHGGVEGGGVRSPPVCVMCSRAWHMPDVWGTHTHIPPIGSMIDKVYCYEWYISDSSIATVSHEVS